MAKKKLQKSTKIKILLTLSTIALVFIFFFGAYFLMTHKSDSAFIDKIYEQKLKIDKMNSSVGDEISKLETMDTSDKEAFKEVVSQTTKAENNIGEILSNLEGSKSPAKYNAKYENLLKAININKRVFSQTKLILKNINSNDLSSAFEELSNDINDTTNAYDLSVINKESDKTHITLPNNILSSPDTLKKYASKAYSDYQEKNTLLQQYISYFNDMDKVISDFQKAKVNLNPNIKMINEGTVSIDKVYINVDNKLIALSDIQNKYSQLSVPPKLLEDHQKLSSFIETYTYYCQDFKTALTNLEASLTDEASTNETNSAFNDLLKKYTDLDKQFNAYKSKYQGNKMFYTDINNL